MTQMMNIEEIFSFLVNDYGFHYKYQEFDHCYNGNWKICTHSFYNDNGCFTIHSLPARGELDFYCSQKFSTVREDLCEKLIDVRSIEPEIWQKHIKTGGFVKPFFWWSDRKILHALAEVLQVHIAKFGEFFGIQVRKG